MVSLKALYSDESNAELQQQLDSKAHYISLGGTNIMSTTNEGMQAIYNLTMSLPGTKLTEEVKF